MSDTDKRLIEDYLPIEAISAEASREKSVRKGHISTLHLWWARRPLVACRAAVYGALVPADRWVKEVQLKNPPDDPEKAEALKTGKKLGLNRKAAADFMKRLCRYPSDSKPEEKADIDRFIQEAQRHILIAHADRLTGELADWTAGKSAKPGWVNEFKWPGEKVTVEDITAGRAPRPRVLDMFAGGGAIPLEALRLGCEAYANDLNPVAHIIELCTLVYPQKYGKPDLTARGMTGPKDKDGNPTWGGLADEVRYWGNWVLKKVKIEIGDLYPLIPDPDFKGKRPPIELDRETGDWVVSRQASKAQKDDDPFAPPQMVMAFAEDAQMRFSPDSAVRNPQSAIPPGYLLPVAYLWTRTVTCKNPACGATVPLVKQTWLCKKDGRYVAMKMVAPKGKKEVRFEVVETRTEKGFGFDPEAFSKGGNASCPFCGTVADSDYVKAEGSVKHIGNQLMACVCRSSEGETKYLATYEAPTCLPSSEKLTTKTHEIASRMRLGLPDEDMDVRDPTTVAGRGFGIAKWREVYLQRQLLLMGCFASSIADAESEMAKRDWPTAWRVPVSTSLAAALDRLANYHTAFNVWRTSRTCVLPLFTRQAIPMVWDSGEMNPFCGSAGDWSESIDYVSAVIHELTATGLAASVVRGSATELPYDSDFFDAIVTDPPYYDNVSYAVLSDFFYVWLKRAVGHLYPQHFASTQTPKRAEAIADAVRHGGNDDARRTYEGVMQAALNQAWSRMKPGAPLVLVYAHKTTLGWSTLVNSLRRAGFEVLEAWPLATEMTGGMRVGTASLASSIFLVARKRDAASKIGNYEADVVPELGSIVRERVETLWDMGISGADLVIACVGAGLRAFTKYARVEFANGEEVPAERFLMEVETVVLETIMGKLSKTVGSKAGATLSGLDPATRFYVLWRYTYGGAELDAGEAIIFANGTHVELDGQHSLSAGTHALLEKKKGKYRLLDFTERGSSEHLGHPAENGTPAAAVDALHRLLWLVEHKPPKIPDFLDEAKPNIEQLRLVAQALAGPALKGGELADVSPSAEQSALSKLLANWNAVMVGKATVDDRRKGQGTLNI